MSNIRNLLKRAGLTADQLSAGTGLPIRTISYHYNSGRMPFTVLYKIKNATGLTIDEIVPKHLAEYWLSLWDEAEKINLPRGKGGNKRKAWVAPTPEEAERIATERAAPSSPMPIDVRKNPLTEDEAIIPQNGVEKKVVSRETPKKRSIADIMRDGANAAPAPAEQAPDFSGVGDELFGTSMAPENTPRFNKKGKR